MIPPTPAVSVPAPLALAIRTGVALLALAAFALSYDALRQMAAASHIHWLLTYAFPLVIDGFIAIGIGALLVLRSAPLKPRLYVSALVGIATVTSIWANVLHAVRLNQQARPGGLALDNITVGAISAIAPLALAGAVHLYLLVQRRPAHAEPRDEGRHITTATTPEGGAAAAAKEPPSDDNVAEQVKEVEEAAEQAAQPEKPSAKRGDQRPMATWDQVLEIGRTAPLGRDGRVSRRHMETAIRDKGLRPGRRERLEKAKALLQAERDQSPTDIAA
ncbi:DUF2637 domain-containing protein [Streptomyces sp. NPDC088190]|uniref:DUF2637 domain-containing protein n=1 Tax=unclassified Streptomyces TaxID=2593676 RepID=UPI002E79F2D3|nr:DUF2637 domain-containing protein [Streptomyces sp. JV190]MEE1844171.1 DUF2637 domain-containing protein [Streptomyces sp. JV190]